MKRLHLTFLVQEPPCCFLMNMLSKSLPTKEAGHAQIGSTDIQGYITWRWLTEECQCQFSNFTFESKKVATGKKLLTERQSFTSAVFCNAKGKWECWQRFTWIVPYQDTSNKIYLTFSFKLWLCLAWQGISETFLSADLFITETLLL